MSLTSKIKFIRTEKKTVLLKTRIRAENRGELGRSRRSKFGREGRKSMYNILMALCIQGLFFTECVLHFSNLLLQMEPVLY